MPAYVLVGLIFIFGAIRIGKFRGTEWPTTLAAAGIIPFFASMVINRIELKIALIAAGAAWSLFIAIVPWESFQRFWIKIFELLRLS